jgi:GNAT superfamily N-acetyltransferase
MSGTVSVRDATPEDWPAMWSFMRQVIAAGDTFSVDPNESEAEARAAWLEDPSGRTFVAVDEEGRIVGTALSHPNHGGPASHVANAGFMVDPAHRGRGVGRALCAHVLDRAREDGYRAMQFNAVVETNTGAVALWRSFGFETLATVPEAFLHPTKGYVGLHIMYRAL